MKEEFTLEGFYERLVRWIAVDDQVISIIISCRVLVAEFWQPINVIGFPELRDLLLFLGTNLEERDLPHRTKLTLLILERFHLEYEKLVNEIKVSILLYFEL